MKYYTWEMKQTLDGIIHVNDVPSTNDKMNKGFL